MPRVAAPTADQRRAYFHGDCPNGIGLPPLPEATIYLDIQLRLELLTTAITSTGCLGLSVSFAVHPTSNISVHVLQKHLYGANTEVFFGVVSTPTRARSSPCYFPHVSAPCEIHQVNHPAAAVTEAPHYRRCVGLPSSPLPFELAYSFDDEEVIYSGDFLAFLANCSLVFIAMMLWSTSSSWDEILATGKESPPEGERENPGRLLIFKTIAHRIKHAFFFGQNVGVSNGKKSLWKKGEIALNGKYRPRKS
jgi:hypothetical protein